jgi:hypothetical protein
VASELARDLIPEISQQPGCRAVTCFGDAESGQYGLYVLWSSHEDADAAATIIAPKLEHYLKGNVLMPADKQLFPVIQAA